MAREIWLISDTHFNHTNILNFKDDKDVYFRGNLFNDVNHMNEVMIENWNKTIKPQDKVYHLGDVYFGNQQEADLLLKRLNGKKRLVVGNHDDVLQKSIWDNFQKVSIWRFFKEFGILCTHVPVHLSTLRRRMGDKEGYMLNVHGHIHQNQSPEGPYKCVCVEHTDYKPVNIEELRIW